MKVILRSDITNVGRQGEVKEVSPGFARNYLVPQNLAMEATPANLKIWERERVKLEKQREEIISAAKEIASKMEAVEFTVKVKIGENGKIFGSVTPANLSKIFEEKGFEVNKRDILLSDNIKEVGNYEVNVRLHPEVVVKVKLAVIGEKE
ncbi:50S ribosomal protein L9 [Candidatus Endomicrobiellum devescovinae]|jgi:large subunit ribosomal protein L9|uniref:50S ribosomal protein L9 n=1 Tax=Candidatus Endomicrobiellum devescovinae TaxID=3242322 RepID=UPI00281AE94E|nr:50S ribosomal protein L9 [Endomicrobium sp.]MDR2818500.1 50S ribosomal protein L9 [Endomicrobium sp.]